MSIVDITNAVNQGDLSVDHVIARYADHFVPKTSKNIQQLEYRYYEEMGLTACYVSRYEYMNLLDSDKIYAFQGLEVSEKNFMYSSSQTPVLGLYITESQSNGGAKGVKVTLGNKNMFFVSGELSGCSVAVLRKGNDYFFVHSGAASTSFENHNEKIENKATVNKYIWKDLFNCCVCMDNRPYLYTNDILEWDDFINGLSALGCYGTIISAVHKKNEEKAYITTNQRFTIINYYNSAAGGDGYYTHDVIAAVNTNHLLSVGTRKIYNKNFSGLYVESAYKTR
jgi:hypothetical protein